MVGYDLAIQKNIPMRMGIQLLAGVLFLASMRWTGISLFGDYLPMELNTVMTSTIIMLDVFFALTVNLALITHYLVARWKEGLVKTERLEKEKSMMRYHNLKNQVNPHFLFNSLSSLQSLVKSNPVFGRAIHFPSVKSLSLCVAKQRKRSGFYGNRIALH